MDWSDLPVFLEVARSGSFTAAARALGLTQSTVSRRMAALEGEVGSALFRRVRHGVFLSPTGSELLPLIEAVEAAMHDVGRRASGLQETVRGTVRVATVEEMATWLLAPALPRLRAAWPELQIELVVSNAIANLSTQEADLALRMSPPDRSDLVGKRLGTIPCAVFGKPGSPDDRPLAELDWLKLDDSLALGPERRWLARQVPVRKVVFRSSSSASLAQAASQGVGVAVLPVPLGQQMGLAPRGEPVTEHVVWLVVHRDIQRIPRIRAVSRWLEACVDELVEGRARGS